MTRARPDPLRDIPEPLRPLLPELCAVLREELEAARTALEAAGRISPGCATRPRAGRAEKGGEVGLGQDATAAQERLHNVQGAAMRFGLRELACEAAHARKAVLQGRRLQALALLAYCEELLGRVRKQCGQSGAEGADNT